MPAEEPALKVHAAQVCLRGEAPHGRRAFGLGEIDRDRSLVAVGREIVRGERGLLSVRVVHEGGAPAARVVAGAGPLDLDHVGPQVGQRLGAPGACQDAREVENTDAVE